MTNKLETLEKVCNDLKEDKCSCADAAKRLEYLGYSYSKAIQIISGNKCQTTKKK